MQIFINDKAEEVKDGICLQELMIERGYKDGKALAMALNGQLVPKTNWAECVLKEGDRLVEFGVFYGG